MLPEAQFDFGELKGFFDRIAGFQEVLLLLLCQLRLSFCLLIGSLSGNGISDEAHAAAERQKGDHRQPGHDCEDEHQGGSNHESPGIGAKLPKHSLLGLPSRSAFRDQ